ncbi:MAG: hypothetical protein IT444_11365 [Phycisphaeraceae bacterium]|nr:hypothetical protein [Phycisphaeraceae bacterium]
MAKAKIPEQVAPFPEVPARAVTIDALASRYAGATPEALFAVLCPLLIPIDTLDRTIQKLPGQGHFRASFTVRITPENRVVLQRGRTGKFVPAAYVQGTGVWREICKGRIIDVDAAAGVAHGEVYTGDNNRKALELALRELDTTSHLEIDQYGASAKVLSGLAEYFFVEHALEEGFTVRRMSEDMARHLGAYNNYDFEVEKNGVTKRIEVKSIWGTDTACARLIHSTTTPPKGEPATWTEKQRQNFYPTSSCKFITQDIFAVSLFLRTGNIRDFAFARSVPRDEKPYGLPRCVEYPEHVHQNPPCQIGNGSWFATLSEVWNLE